MKKEEILKEILKRAKRDKLYRQDPRYKETMGFLLAKGFLKSDLLIPLLPNKRIILKDAIWAGKNVEPRILEVLPAAILRLPKHFDLDSTSHVELFVVVKKLKNREEKGEPLWGIPYEKIKIWADLSLKDGRMKDFEERKITKTFRLTPKCIAVLKERSRKLNCSETEILEKAILKG